MKPLTGQSARPIRSAFVRGRPLPANQRVASSLFTRLPLTFHTSSVILFFLVIFWVGCMAVPSAFAVTCTSVAGGGNWDAPATWTGCAGGSGSPANTPGPGDTAIIAGPVIANVTTPVAAITVNASQALTINGGVTLTATTITVNSLSTVTNNGAVTAGSLAGSSGGTWTQGPNGVLNYSGASITPVLDASAVGNTVTYNGAAAQTVKSATYYDLVINNPGQVATLGGATVVNETLTVAGGTLNSGAVALTVNGVTDVCPSPCASGTLGITGSGAKTFVGLVFVESGGTWTNTTYPVNFRGGLKNEGTFTAGTGVQTFDTNNQAITGQSASAITIANLTVNGVTLTNNGQLRVATTFSGTGSVTQGMGANLAITTNTVGPTLNASASGNTVTYNGPAQTISPAAYYQLFLAGSGNKTAPSTMSVAKNFIMNPNLGNTATFVNSSGTVTFNGSGAQSFSNSLGNTTFHHLTISNSGGSANPVTLGSPVTVNGNLTVSNGTLSDGGNLITGNGTGTLTIGYGAGLTLMAAPGAPFPSFGSTSLDAASTVTYGGAGNQTIANVAAYGSLTLGGSGTKTAPAGTLTIRGDYTNTATLNANGGTVLLNGTVQQTLTGAMTGPSAFNNLTVTNSSGVDDAGCGDPSFVPGVIFSAAAQVTNTYAITTGSVRVQYLAGAIYTFANVNWNGQLKSTRIFFRSSLFGSPWYLNVTGSQMGAPPSQMGVGFLNVSDSNALIGQPITAVNSIDCGLQPDLTSTNVNWTFITLSEPITTTLTPSSAPPNTPSLPAALIGANYAAGATVVFNVYNGSAWVSDATITGLGSCANDGTTPTTKINCTISIAAVAALGYRQVIVTNPDGGVAPPAYFYVGAITSTAMIVYGTSNSNDPKYRLLQPAGSWTPELSVGSGSGAPRWAVLRASPLSAEKVLGVLDPTRKLTLLTWGGNGWGPPVTATLSSGPAAAVPSTRSFDLAYEQQSGRALAVYGVGGSAFPRYRIWDGTAWSAETTIVTALNTANVVSWVRLVPRPGSTSNQIVLLYGDFSGAINTLVWDGTSFGSEQLLTTNAASTQVQSFDGAAEQSSCAADDAALCQVVAVWTTSTSNTPLYQAWDGTAWGSAQPVPITPTPNAGDLLTVRLAADPSSDGIAAGVVSASGQLSVSQWDGSVWQTSGTGAPSVVGAIPPALASSTRPFDLVWLGPAGASISRLIVVSSDMTAISNSWTMADGWASALNLSPSTSLRGQWHLDETGVTLADSSGNGNTLTLSAAGATAGQAGILNNAVLFSGGSASTAANPASLNITGSTLTMKAWVYPTEFPASGIILSKESAYQMAINHGLLQAAVMTNSGGGCAWSWLGSTALSLQAWQHIDVTYDGSNLRFYVNGLLQQTVALTGTICTSSNAVMIGARPSGYPFIGRIDEVAVTSGIHPPPASMSMDADRISQDLVTAIMNQRPILGADYGTGLFWNPSTITTATPSGVQAVFTDTFYPQSFSLSYERNLTQTQLTVLSASPASSSRGQTQTVTITGTQFDPAATVSILCTLPGCVNGVTNPLIPTSVTSTSLTVDVPIASTATPGLRNIQVTNPSQTAVGYNLFTVTSIVVASTVCPDNSSGTPPCTLSPGAANQPVVINGSGFNATSTVSFSGTGITQNGLPVVSGGGTIITINVTIAPSAATGLRNVTVTNTAPADSMTANSLLSIVTGPTVTSVSPTSGAQGDTFPCSSAPTDCVTVNGTGFQSGLTTDFGPGITVTNPCLYVSSTQLYCAVSIASNAAAGYRTVTVTNPSPPAGNAGSGGNATAFQVLAVPVVTGTDCGFGSPCQLAQGVVNRTITVNGTNFSNVGGTPTVTVTGGASGSVQVVAVSCNLDGNGLCVSLAVTVNVASNAAIGLWDVTVTNPAGAGGYSSGTSGNGTFQVVAQPTISTITPVSAAQGASLSGGSVMTITGTNFQNGATITFKLPGGSSDTQITQTGVPAQYLAIPTTWVSSSQVTVAVDIGTAALVGGRTIALTNPNGGSAIDTATFSVTAGSTATCPGAGGNWTPVSNATIDGAVTPDVTCTTVTVNSGITVTIKNGAILAVNDATTGMTINAGGTVTFGDAAGNGYGRINAVALTVVATGLINADGTGCGASTSYVSPFSCVNEGNGGPTSPFGEGGDHSVAGGGAGYGGTGGAGGAGGPGQGGFSYGASVTPSELGSGGGNGGSDAGGAGGGAVTIMVSGTLTVNGTIRSNGASGTSDVRTGGGGSGGAIYLLTANLAGSGTFQAAGGNGGNVVLPGSYGGGGGGGGRIAVYVSGTNSFSGPSPSCNGGTGGIGNPSIRNGQAGSSGSCFITSSTVTTIGDGVNPLNVTVAPGSADQSLDQFTLGTTAGTDSVTALTVTTTNTAAIASIKIMLDDLSTQYFTTVSSPSGNAWNFSGGTPIPVGLTGAAFRVVVTFQNQVTLDGLGKILYPVTGTVTALTTSNPQVGSDATSATITVDNQPPADAVWGTVSPGNNQVILNWTNPADTDFSEVVILRNTVSITDIPADGTSYTAPGTIGTSAIVYVGNLQTFTDTGLTNGTAYYYKIFSQDVYGNYAAGVQTGPVTPTFQGIFGTNDCPNPGTMAFTISSNTICTGNLTVAGGAVLTLSGDITLTVNGTILVTGPGSQIVAVPVARFVTIQATTLTADAGTVIDANGSGCTSSQSFNVAAGSGCVNKSGGATAGYGEGADANGGSGGAGYGGAGGNGGIGNGGFAYGSAATPLELGSGGGNGSSALGGTGGGALVLSVSNTLTINGTIRSNGTDGTGGPTLVRTGGGGSGGALYVVANVLTGAGSFQANGGNGGAGDPSISFPNDGGGGGGGGRIAVYYLATNTFTGTMACAGGTGGANGGVNGAAGTCPAPLLTSVMTTLATGSDPTPSTVAPGASDQLLDRFALSTSGNTDTVTALTVTTTTTAAIASVKIMSDDLSTQYFATVSSPSGNAWNFSGGTPIPVGIAAASFQVVATFQNQATLDGLGKVLYPVTGTVTALTTSNPQAGSDATSGTITVDNLPPANAAWGTITHGDTQNVLTWVNPTTNADASPLTDLAQAVILRNTVPITDAPADGSNYTAPGSIGTSTIVYVGGGTTFTDTGLINGTGYYYTIFSEDDYGNYSTGVQTGPETPNIVPCSSISIPSTLTQDTKCTGDLAFSSGTLTLQGDVTLTVTGNLTVTGTAKIVADPANTFVGIVATNLTLGAGALIDANGTGCGPSQSFDVTTGSGCVNKGSGATTGFGEGGDIDDATGAGGAGFGGAGGAGGPISGSRPGGAGGDTYGLLDLSTGVMPGSGGGNGTRNLPIIPGGAGGGAIKLVVSGTLTVDGTIQADGLPGTNDFPNPSGGGSGGSIYIDTYDFAGAASGLIQAGGGAGGQNTVTSANAGGGGGGGRIVVKIQNSDAFLGSKLVPGGAAGGSGATAGQLGTTVIISSSSSSCDYESAATFVINSDLTCANLTVINGATLILSGDLTLTVTGDVLVGTGSTIVVHPLSTFVRIVAGNVTVDAGAAITADGTGCGPGLGLNLMTGFGCTNSTTDGPGRGLDATSGTTGFLGGGGGGASGAGGARYGQATGGGAAYGDTTSVIMGSGGGAGVDPSRGNAPGGAGGGALDLCVGSFTSSCTGSGTLTVNGTISANGLSGGVNIVGDEGGGGGGGSLKITAGTLAGNGLLQANGGNGGPPFRSRLVGIGGGGGGGRIYINAGTIVLPLSIYNVQAWGGLSYNNISPGAAGSIVIVDGPAPPAVTLSGGGIVEDVLDGANDGTQTYSALTVLGGPAGADNRTIGTFTFGTSLHVLGALNADASMTVNGTLTADGLMMLTGGTTTVNGPLLAPGSPVTVAGAGHPALRINGDHDSTVNLLTVGNGTVNSGAVMLVAAGTTVGHAYSHLTVATSVTINSGGALHGDGLGCGPSLGFNITTGSGCTNSTTDGPGQGVDHNGNGGGGGGGYGGVGGAGGNGGAGGATYGGATLATIMPGSGGGNNSSADNFGGSGGGSIKLDVTNALTVNGRLSVNGASDGIESSVRTTGGGSGGSLYITTGALTGTGKVQANGGNGGVAASGNPSFNGGGGGGGRIVINTGVPLTAQLTISAAPGSGASPSGDPGTVVTILTSPDTTPPASASVTASLVPIGSGPCAPPLQLICYTDRTLLTWTAVGDDGTTGTASSYALGYSTAPITTPVTNSIFDGLTPVNGLGSPQLAGTPESFTVTGLLSNQTYYFVLKVCDEVPNCSFSNVAQVVVPLDTNPPAPVIPVLSGGTLTTGTVTSTSVVLQWNSPGDDGSPAPCPCGTPKYYIVKYSTSVITSGNFSSAPTFNDTVVPKGDGTSATIHVTGGIAPLAAGLAEFMNVIGLMPNTTYYFAIDAVDEVGNEGPFGGTVSAATPPVADAIPPGQINTLQVVSVTDRAVQLKWTASGNDGSTGGPAAAYDLRYSPFEIITGTGGDCESTIGFDQTSCPNGAQVSDLLHQVTTGVPIPGQPGSGQSMTADLCETMNGLGECVGSFQHATSNTNYFFAIRVIDEAGNLSPLGTLINTNISDPIDPACDGSGTSQNCDLRTTMRLDPVHAVLVSVPLQGPLAPTPIFGPLDGVANWCGANDQPCLYKWLSTGLLETDGTYQLMDGGGSPCVGNCVNEGEGYYFFTNILSLLDYIGTNVTGVTDGYFGGTTPHADYTLQQGMNLIGNPFKKNVQLQNSHIVQTGGGSCTLGEMTFAQAVTAGVVGNAIYVWTGAAAIPVVYNAVPPAVIQPWQGYELFVLDATCGYQLLIPEP